MGNQKISTDLKESALQLWELGYELDFISESLCICQVSRYQWCNIFAEFSSVNWPPSASLHCSACQKLSFTLCWMPSGSSITMKQMHILMNLSSGLAFTMISHSYSAHSTRTFKMPVSLKNGSTWSQGSVTKNESWVHGSDLRLHRGVELVLIDEFNKNMILLNTMDVHLLDNAQTLLKISCMVIGIPCWQKLASVAMMWYAQSSDYTTVTSSRISS